MSQVVSTRLPNHTAEQLKRLARRLGKTAFSWMPFIPIL